MKKNQNTILNKGTVINDTYTVQCFIGKGAFGEVYRVKHKFLGVQVLKVLKADYVANTDLNIVTNEALVLTRLTHKNIVKVFDTNIFEYNDKTYHFISMEFVSGESLAQFNKRKISLSLPVSLSIQIALLSALSELQNQLPPLVHRDISPDNILLCYDDETPRALLSDFGLVQSIDQVSSISKAAGKLLYLAPECFWNVYLPSSDVFSAGIVFYRMLTGSHPWNYDFDEIEIDDAESLRTMILRARNVKIRPPSFYNEECNSAIDEIVLKALAKDIENRYSHAEQFLNDLKVEFEKNEKNYIQKENIENLYY